MWICSQHWLTENNSRLRESAALPVFERCLSKMLYLLVLNMLSSISDELEKDWHKDIRMKAQNDTERFQFTCPLERTRIFVTVLETSLAFKYKTNAN